MESNEFISSLEKMLLSISPIVQQEKQRKKEAFKRGESFNIFNVLGLTSNEVRLHSAFIAELLNPKGAHGCGCIFLQEFVEKCITDGIDNIPDKFGEADVSVEKYIGPISTDYCSGGQIDIVVEIGNFLILIENKIYAGDQKNQLKRYKNYGDESYRKHKLFYLTLDGRDASNESCCELKKGYDYFLLSYKKDILNWLNACREKCVEKPLVRETITQYINLIKKLTGLDMDTNNQNQNEMFAVMANHPDVAKEIFHVGFEKFRDYLFREYCINKFIDEAQKIGLIFNQDTILDENKEAGYYFYKSDWKYFRIYVYSENYYKDFYIGISFENDDNIIKSIGNNKYPQLFAEKATKEWPMGYEFLISPYRYMIYSSIIPYLINGEYVKYIIGKVRETLNNIEQYKVEML